ncbi:Uncharacterised protein [Yersinia aldovae]|uniref:hypothetical protein n=1 Tax=Yersinia aldovae TaxID=29483 RepID=UPI0005E32CA6|nr:hypothetical protein [Yersinia aldovae]CNI95078.1 Uncharacterised protein [Yersinia aldovae]
MKIFSRMLQSIKLNTVGVQGNATTRLGQALSQASNTMEKRPEASKSKGKAPQPTDKMKFEAAKRGLETSKPKGKAPQPTDKMKFEALEMKGSEAVNRKAPTITDLANLLRSVKPVDLANIQNALTPALVQFERSRINTGEEKPKSPVHRGSEALKPCRPAPKPPLNLQFKAVTRDVKADPVAANAKEPVTTGQKFSGRGRQIQRPSSPPPAPPVTASAKEFVTTGQSKPSREPADLSPPTTADVYISNVANSLTAALKEFKADKVKAREKWLGPASSSLTTQPLKMHRTEQ